MQSANVSAPLGVAVANPGADPPAGLRERKKRRTRETIAAVALELFASQGYDETTIAQVAERAEVSPRTVSAYFPAKEDLAFPDQEERFEQLAARLRARDATEMAPEALRGWIQDCMADWKGDELELHARRCVIDASDALQAHEQLFMNRLQELLSAELARDLGADPCDLEPRIAAASTAAVLVVLNEHMAAIKRGGTATPDLEEIERQVLETLDRAVVFSSAGIRALRDLKRGSDPG